jgi:ribosomal protein L32
MRRRTTLLILGGIAAALGLVSGYVAFNRSSHAGTYDRLTCLSYPTLGVIGITWFALYWIRRDREDANQTPGTQRCFSCGYSTEGLDHKICPECGKRWRDSSPWGEFPTGKAAIATIVVSWILAAFAGSILRAAIGP